MARKMKLLKVEHHNVYKSPVVRFSEGSIKDKAPSEAFQIAHCVNCAFQAFQSQFPNMKTVEARLSIIDSFKFIICVFSNTSTTQLVFPFIYKNWNLLIAGLNALNEFPKLEQYFGFKSAKPKGQNYWSYTKILLEEQISIYEKQAKYELMRDQQYLKKLIAEHTIPAKTS